MSSVNILVPELPESVVNASVVTWHKKIGDTVRYDEVLVDIETDKVILEIPSVIDGILEEILEIEGSTVTSNQILGRLKKDKNIFKKSNIITNIEETNTKEFILNKPQEKKQINHSIDILSPAVRRLISEYNLDISKIKGSGVGGRINRIDIEQYLTEQSKLVHQNDNISVPNIALEKTIEVHDRRTEKRIPMNRLRKRIAERLLEVKNNTAMLTTFNEVNMKPIINLRKKYGDLFEKKHSIRLGLMSFYVKAVTESLKSYPAINGSIDADDIIYHNYFDISIAISTPRGLVTPVLRDVDKLSMAEIEKKIKDFSIKANDNKLTLDDLTGGNFTITNGGIFGSLMSTPIINPPQSAILGMHTIKNRPMVVDDQIVILPMMYLALSYDHRLIDGRESVSYLLSIKNFLEDPIRLFLDV